MTEDLNPPESLQEQPMLGYIIPTHWFPDTPPSDLVVATDN